VTRFEEETQGREIRRASATWRIKNQAET